MSRTGSLKLKPSPLLAPRAGHETTVHTAMISGA